MNIFFRYGKIGFILLLMGFLLPQHGCEQLKYSPSGIVENEIKDPHTTNEIWVTDSTLDTDTLRVWDDVKIHYNFAANRPVLKVIVRLNDTTINESGSSGIVRFYPNRYPDGFYFLTFDIFLKPESGSLADRLNREVFETIKRYPLYIDNRNPVPVEITSMHLEDGTLRIRWQKYPYHNFQYYHLWLGGRDPIEINNQNLTFYDLNSYIGNKYINANISVRGKNRYVSGPTKQYNYPYKPILERIRLENAQPVLKWKACPFYHNLKYYEIKLSHEKSYGTDNVRAQLQNASNTTFKDKAIKFGAKYYYHVRAVSNEKSYAIPSPLKSAFLGSAIPTYARVHYIPSTNSIYLNPADFFGIQSEGKIYRLNAQTMVPVASFPIRESSLAISEDGQDLFAHAPFSSHKRTIYKLNPLDLSVESTFSMDTTVLKADEWPTMESIVYIAPHKLLFRVSNGKTERLVKYDYLTGDTTSKSFPATGNYGPHIVARSYLGKYLLIQLNKTYTIYDVSGDTFIPKATIDDPNYFCFGGKEDTYIITHQPDIVIRNCDTDEVIKRIHIYSRSLKFPSVDLVTGFLGGTVDKLGEYYYQIYDLHTGEKIYELPTTNLGKYYLSNKKLFSRAGLCLNLNF